MTLPSTHDDHASALSAHMQRAAETMVQARRSMIGVRPGTLDSSACLRAVELNGQFPAVVVTTTYGAESRTQQIEQFAEGRKVERLVGTTPFPPHGGEVLVVSKTLLATWVDQIIEVKPKALVILDGQLGSAGSKFNRGLRKLIAAMSPDDLVIARVIPKDLPHLAEQAQMLGAQMPAGAPAR